MAERAILIPGYGSNLTSPAYDDLHDLAADYYEEVVAVDVSWRQDGIFEDWFTEVAEQVPEGKSDVIAYSCGALLALQLGVDKRTLAVEIDRATLLSVSCWGGNPQSMKLAAEDGMNFTPAQVESFEELPVGWMAHMFRAKSIDLLCGEGEMPEMIRRSQDVHALMDGRAALTMIPGARHADMLKKPVLRTVRKLWGKPN